MNRLSLCFLLLLSCFSLHTFAYDTKIVPYAQLQDGRSGIQLTENKDGSFQRTETDVLIKGKAEHGLDIVISRVYDSLSFHAVPHWYLNGFPSSTTHLRLVERNTPQFAGWMGYGWKLNVGGVLNFASWHDATVSEGTDARAQGQQTITIQLPDRVCRFFRYAPRRDWLDPKDTTNWPYWKNEIKGDTCSLIQINPANPNDGFILTTSDGTEYSFALRIHYRRLYAYSGYSRPFIMDFWNFLENTFYLTKIKNPYNEVLDFEYESANAVYRNAYSSWLGEYGVGEDNLPLTTSYVHEIRKANFIKKSGLFYKTDKLYTKSIGIFPYKSPNQSQSDESTDWFLPTRLKKVKDKYGREVRFFYRAPFNVPDLLFTTVNTKEILKDSQIASIKYKGVNDPSDPNVDRWQTIRYVYYGDEQTFNDSAASKNIKQWLLKRVELPGIDSVPKKISYDYIYLDQQKNDADYGDRGYFLNKIQTPEGLSIDVSYKWNDQTVKTFENDYYYTTRVYNVYFRSYSIDKIKFSGGGLNAPEEWAYQFNGPGVQRIDKTILENGNFYSGVYTEYLPIFTKNYGKVTITDPRNQIFESTYGNSFYGGSLLMTKKVPGIEYSYTYNDRMYLTSSTEKHFEGSSYLTKSTSFEYDDYRNLTTVIKNGAYGKIKHTFSYRYASDPTIPDKTVVQEESVYSDRTGIITTFVLGVTRPDWYLRKKISYSFNPGALLPYQKDISLTNVNGIESANPILSYKYSYDK